MPPPPLHRADNVRLMDHMRHLLSLGVCAHTARPGNLHRVELRTMQRPKQFVAALF